MYSVADIFADPHYRAREMLVSVPHPVFGELVMPGVTPKLSATPGSVPPGAGWEAGVDNASVFGALLGIDAAELSVLSGEGVI